MIIALRDIDSEAEFIPAGSERKVGDISAAGLFVRLDGHRASLRIADFKRVG